MKTSLLLLAVWVQTSAFGLSNANTLASQLKTNPNDTFLKHIEESTGYLAMLAANPISVTEDGTKATVKPLQRAHCSAVYIGAPNLFLTSADCLADAQGKVDAHRRYSRLFIKGKGYSVDPASIVIHENHRKTQAIADLAVFALHQDEKEAKTFAEEHDVISITASTSLFSDGSQSTFAGYGSQSEEGTDFGTLRTKDVLLKYPSPDDLSRAQGKLNVGPQEHVLTFVTRPGEKGLNCGGDSGGGVFSRRVGSVDHSGEVAALQGIIIGKVGPDGDASAPCESLTRYAVVVDLRYETEWIESALIKSVENRRAAFAEHRAYRTEVDSKFSDRQVFTHWVSSPPGELAETLAAQHFNNTYRRIRFTDYLMQQNEARFKVAQSLTANSETKQPVSAPVSLEISEPYEVAGDGWNYLNYAKKSWGFRFFHGEPKAKLARVAVTNVGDETIDISQIVGEGGDYLFWTGNGAGYQLLPGQTQKLHAKAGLFTIDNLRFVFRNGTEKKSNEVLADSLLVTALLATKKEINAEIAKNNPPKQVTRPATQPTVIMVPRRAMPYAYPYAIPYSMPYGYGGGVRVMVIR